MTKNNRRLIQASLQPLRNSRTIENFPRAAPGESETGAAVPIVVNDGATGAEMTAFDTPDFQNGQASRLF
jgi:hypothetical protein